MRVLIADDQKSVGTSLAELVRLCKHEVVEVVGSGLEAIQAYGRHHPDVVLMDYHMPKLNGATACRNIMAKYPNARGNSRLRLSQGCRRFRRSVLLTKPVSLDQLYEALYMAARQPAKDAEMGKRISDIGLRIRRSESSKSLTRSNLFPDTPCRSLLFARLSRPK